jgi:hypothetical protein
VAFWFMGAYWDFVIKDLEIALTYERDFEL